MANISSTSTSNLTTERVARMRRNANRELRNEWIRQCLANDDEATELILEGVAMPQYKQNRAAYNILWRITHQHEEANDIKQDDHARGTQEEETQKQEAEGLTLRSRTPTDSESSGNSSTSEAEEGGFKKWMRGAGFAEVDQGGFKAWETTPTSEEVPNDEWRFGKGTNTDEKPSKACDLLPTWNRASAIGVASSWSAG